jgi:phospholipid/cholesterol/gamma-HCH transport system permease protein
MLKTCFSSIYNFFVSAGESVFFCVQIIGHILCGHIRYKEVFKQIFEQGVQSILIVVLASVASGIVLGLQGYVILARFDAKIAVAHLVALCLLRELSPVFTALIFSGKAGARITAELATMKVNDQILATRTMGVDPVEFLIVPRFLACCLVLPILTVVSEVVGLYGGYIVGVSEANINGKFYIMQTFKAIRYLDFFSGFIKVFFFAGIIGWICCYQGFSAKGGSLGVGRFTTRAVAYSYIFVILSNALLTKFILTFWG